MALSLGTSFTKQIKVFLCQMGHGSLPTAEVLSRRHIIHEPNCRLCGGAVENLKQLFYDFVTTEHLLSHLPSHWISSHLTLI